MPLNIVSKTEDESEISMAFRITKQAYDSGSKVRKGFYIKELFPNGVRFQRISYEKKNVKVNIKTLRIIDGEFVTFHQTISSESLCEIPTSAPFKVIARSVLDVFEVGAGTVRISIEQHVANNTIQFYCTAEYETNKEIEIGVYEESILKQEILYNIVKSHKVVGPMWDAFYAFPRYTTNPLLHAIPSRSFTTLSEYAKSGRNGKLILVPKLDGIKGRLYQLQGNVFLSVDSGYLKTFKLELFSSVYDGIIFQFEYIESEKQLIFTDIIGFYPDTSLYRCDATDAINFIFKMEEKLLVKKIENFGPKNLEITIHTQITQAKNNKYKKFTRTDGNIIITGAQAVKLKVPTIDAVFNKSCQPCFSNCVKPFDDHHYKLTAGPTDVYELRHNQGTTGGKYEIMRNRIDRIFPSSKEEFIRFGQDYKYFLSIKNQSSVELTQKEPVPVNGIEDSKIRAAKVNECVITSSNFKGVGQIYSQKRLNKNVNEGTIKRKK